MSNSTSNNPSFKKTAFVGNTGSKTRKAPSVGSQKKSVYGPSRTLLSSSSRKNNGPVAGGSDKAGVAPSGGAPVQVLDDEGRDVTPLPLLTVDPTAVRKNQSNMLNESAGGTPTDVMSQTSIYQTGTVTASTFGGPFTRSVFSASISGRSTGSIEDSMGEATDNMQVWEAKVTYKREEVPEDLDEEDLEKFVDIDLTETDTLWLLDMPGVCVSLESDEAQAVREQNARYKELVRSRVGNDLYVERGMNTFNNAPKYKHVQTSKIGYTDIGVNATTWDMYDTHKLIEEQEAKAKAALEDEDSVSSVNRPVSGKIEAESDEFLPKGSTTKGLESQGTMLSSMADSVFNSTDSGVMSIPEEKKIAQIYENENFRHDLQVMERVINMNSYQARQAAYRGFDVVNDMDKVVEAVSPEQAEKEAKKVSPPISAPAPVAQDYGPNLERLWEYKCPMTKGRNVSCIAWNKKNPDLLAVGYGQFEFTKQKSGLICCWSLKNPEFPERVYTTEVGVTALDFSQVHSNLLAAGLYNGTVAIYNVRSMNNEPILDSLNHVNNKSDSETTGKHTGPVWQLKWIEKERGSGDEKTEVLVSISTDGRVTQWSIRKGFDSYDLMKLKRSASKTVHGKTKKAEALISKFAGGLCFEFHTQDTNIYLAGTEEGHIHRCSCSYNEQYLDSYHGHTGPVYGLQWSPFAPEVFLSCSGDWSIRLWHEDRTKPVLNFFSSTKSIPSVCWSPRCATVFACVNEGSVEVWDLKQSTLDPIITNVPSSGVKLSAVTFARNSECILVGDSEGQVTVYQLKSMPKPPPVHEQYDSLHNVIKASLATELAAT